MNDTDHVLTSTADDNGWEQECYLFWIASLSVTFKKQRKAFLSNLSRSVFRVNLLKLHLPTSVGLGAYSSWPAVTQHHHLLADISSSTAEGHFCSRCWFGYASIKKVIWCVWFLEQGTGFDDLKLLLRTRYACILSAFLMNWRLGKEKDKNYFIPSEI